jgi:hypothetical protein
MTIVNSQTAIREYINKDISEDGIKERVLQSIANKLKRGHHRFTTPYEAEGRIKIYYFDAQRAYSNGRDSSYPLNTLELLDLIILLSELE